MKKIKKKKIAAEMSQVTGLEDKARSCRWSSFTVLS